MKKSHLLNFLLIAPLIFLAGCQMPGPTPGGVPGPTPPVRSGLVIQKFSPDVKEPFAGDIVTLTVVVANVGEADATNVKVKLTPPGTDWVVRGDKEIILNDLQKSQPEYGIAGGVDTASWVLEIPEREKGEKTAYVKVFYSYETLARAQITVYNFEYYKMKVAAKEEINETAVQNLDVSLGPIEVTIKKPGEEVQLLPFLFREPGDRGSLLVYISNVGGGYVFLDELGDRSVRVDVRVGGETCIKDEVVQLPPLSPKSVICEFSLPEVEDLTKIPLEVKVSYNYMIEGETSISVRPSIE